MRRPAAYLAFIFLFVLAIMPVSDGQSTGVSVANVAPEFSKLNITRLNGYYHAVVIASDFNGWEDISSICVEIYADEGADYMDASFDYRQVLNDDGSVDDVFNDTYGGWLSPSTSSYGRWSGSTYRSVCFLNVTFHFKPHDGKLVHITISDKAGETAEYWGPFATVEDIEVTQKAQVTVFVSFVAATIGTAIMVAHRYGRNKVLAELHEKIMKLRGNGNT